MQGLLAYAIMRGMNARDDYAALHVRAARLLRRLQRLDLDKMPGGLRARLLAQRADLEALVEATDPTGEPLLKSLFRALDRPLPVEELWAWLSWSVRAIREPAKVN